MNAPYNSYPADFIPSPSNLHQITTKILAFEQGIADIEINIQQRRMIIDTRTAIRKVVLKELRKCLPENELLAISLTSQLDAVNEEIGDDWREHHNYVGQLARCLRVRALLWEQRDLALQNSAP